MKQKQILKKKTIHTHIEARVREREKRKKRKQQFTDDNLRQVTSQPKLPSRTRTEERAGMGGGGGYSYCFSLLSTMNKHSTRPPTHLATHSAAPPVVFYVNEFIYYYFIFSSLCRCCYIFMAHGLHHTKAAPHWDQLRLHLLHLCIMLKINFVVAPE